MRRIVVVAFLAVVAGLTIGAFLLTKVDAVPATEMYWTQDGTTTNKIQRANPNVSPVVVADVVTAGLAEPSGIAVDTSGLKVYWTDVGTDKIQRDNLNGGNVENLITDLDDPRGIALDVAGGKMYWTESGTNKGIRRADLGGGGKQNLVTTQINQPWGIALDVAGGKMYWTDMGNDEIKRANLNGTSAEVLISGLNDPRGIAVAGGKMYWTEDGTTNKIRRANLNGSSPEDVVSTGLDAPSGIAVDAVGGKVYWTDTGTNKIQRKDLNGGSPEGLVTTDDHPIGIALYLYDAPAPVGGIAELPDVSGHHLRQHQRPRGGLQRDRRLRDEAVLLRRCGPAHACARRRHSGAAGGLWFVGPELRGSGWTGGRRRGRSRRRRLVCQEAMGEVGGPAHSFVASGSYRAWPGMPSPRRPQSLRGV